jgi:hypothetical protein
MGGVLHNQRPSEKFAVTRLTMELIRTPAGHLEGTVEVGSDVSVPFSGTLELLKVLHDVAADVEVEKSTER